MMKETEEVSIVPPTLTGSTPGSRAQQVLFDFFDVLPKHNVYTGIERVNDWF